MHTHVSIVTVPGPYVASSDTTAFLRGDFKHNPGRRFAVVRSLTTGEAVDGQGNEVVLSARASVISAVRLPASDLPVYPVADGDVITVDGQRFRIADDRMLCDPRLVPVP